MSALKYLLLKQSQDGFFFFFLDKGPGWPRTHFSDNAGPEFRDPPASTVLRLKTMLSFVFFETRFSSSLGWFLSCYVGQDDLELLILPLPPITRITGVTKTLLSTHTQGITM